MGSRIAALVLLGAAMWSGVSTSIAQESAPAALELYIFHNPSCSVCRKILTLAEEWKRQTPGLIVHPVDDTKPGAAEKARELKRQTKVRAEAWGPSRALFMGDGWLTPEGQDLIQRFHAALLDRVAVEPMAWVSDSLTEMSRRRDRVQILADLQGLNASLLLRSGLWDSLRFPWLTGLLFLVGLLVATGRSSGRTLAAGLGFCAGLVGAHTLEGMGKLAGLHLGRSHVWVSLALHGGLALAALGLALFWLRRYRQEGRSGAGAASREPSLAAAGDRAGEYAARRRLAGQGFLAGLILCALTVLIAPAARLPVLAEVWRLGELPGAVLGLLGAHLLGVVAPALLVTLIAYGLCAAPRVRTWAQQHRPETILSGFLLFLIMAAFLLANVALLLVNFLAA